MGLQILENLLHEILYPLWLERCVGVSAEDTVVSAHIGVTGAECE